MAAFFVLLFCFFCYAPVLEMVPGYFLLVEAENLLEFCFKFFLGVLQLK